MQSSRLVSNTGGAPTGRPDHPGSESLGSSLKLSARARSDDSESRNQISETRNQSSVTDSHGGPVLSSEPAVAQLAVSLSSSCLPPAAPDPRPPAAPAPGGRHP